MLEKNYSLHFENMSCTVLDHNGCEMMTINMRFKVFPINWKEIIFQTSTTFVDDSTLWHKRFRHFNYDALKRLHDKS